MTSGFLRDERGQSLVFAALTFFAVVVVALIIVGVGEATTNQMEMQNAADAGAYAAALVLADAVSQIAWLNEAMAHVYYHTLRYAVDTATTGVYAELQGHAPYYGGAIFTDYVLPGDAVVGLANASGRYGEAYRLANEWIPKGEAWLARLARLERGIAILAPEAVENQAYYTAFHNGAERVAFYPEAIKLLPRSPTHAACDIERILDAATALQGWHIWSTLAETLPFDFTAIHEPDPGNPGDPHFPPGEADDLWRVDYTEGDAVALHFDVYTYYLGDPNAYPLQYAIHYNDAHGQEHYYIALVPDAHTVTVIDEGQETTVEIYEGPGGTEYVIGDVRIRQTPSGELQYWSDSDGDGEVDPNEWLPLEEDTQIGGVSIPVDWTPVIDTPSGRITIDDPLHLDFSRVTLSLPLYIDTPSSVNVEIDYRTPAGAVRVEHNEKTGEYSAAINGLSTLHPDETWSRRNASDQSYHRLFLLDGEEADQTVGPWRYEWVRIGSYLEEMNGEHFALHALMDHDPTYAGHHLSPAWDGHYFDPTAEDASLWSARPGSSRWRYYPRWAQPPRTEEGASDGQYGGWFDITQGRPRRYNGAYTLFSQTRTCWYSRDNGPGALRDYDIESPTYGKLCVRPCGFWHEWFSGFDHLNRATARVAGLNAAWKAADLPPGMHAAFVIQALSNSQQTTIQVTCPCCARKIAWRDLLEGPPLADEAELHRHPSVVRKYLADLLGRHSDSRPSDPFARKVEPQDRVSVEQPSSMDPDRWQLPLALTAEIFRRGITVGAWKSSIGARIYQILGGREPTSSEERLGIANPFPREEDLNPTRAGWEEVSGEDRLWGHFGIATARLAFWSEMNDRDELVRARSFPPSGYDYGRRPEWISDPEANIDPLGRPVNWYREMWLRSQMNHFEPDWDAVLVSNRNALDIRDMQFFAENGGTAAFAPDDTAASFLFREMGGKPWWESIVSRHRARYWDRRWTGPRRGAWDVGAHWNHMAAPPMQGPNRGRAVNYRDPAIDEVVRH
ncbi:MAG: pilus assembly protein TadG-related protein [Planctomycetota bacterium]